MTLACAIVGAFVAPIPGASFFLIPLEMFLFWYIAHRSPRFNLMEFLGMGALMAAVSGVLKGLASFLHVVPVFGQFANSMVAFAFILFLGVAVRRHYAA